ncbi:MAG: hypothetical protein FJ009_18515 [Chloroflexi bacterium]|nr:hypothetical protein [Chloroflexota bacterium]
MDQLLALPFWAITFYLFRPRALRQGSWRKPTGVLARLFTLTAALSLTLQSDPVALWLGHATGIRNLSWLLAYILGVVTTYCGFSAWTYLRENHLPRRAAVLAAIAIVLLVIAFPPLADLPEISHSAAVNSSEEVAFRIVLYLFMGLMSIEGLRVFKQFARQEELPTGKLRIGLLIGSLYCALGFALTRLFNGIALLRDWTSPLTAAAWALGSLLIALCVLGFALAFAPLRWFRIPARLFMYIEQQQTRRDLERLCRQLVDLTAPLPWPQPRSRERWFQPSYAIYCVLVDILDRRSFLLAERQEREARGAVPPGLAPLLADLPETDDWVVLLQHVRQIARGVFTSSTWSRNES